MTHDKLHQRMGRLVQIRDVPEDVHRTLKARAAMSGVSLSEYLRGELARMAARPAVEELSGRFRTDGRDSSPRRSEPLSTFRAARAGAARRRRVTVVDTSGVIDFLLGM